MKMYMAFVSTVPLMILIYTSNSSCYYMQMTPSILVTMKDLETEHKRKKNKILVFSRGRLRQVSNFKIGDRVLE